MSRRCAALAPRCGIGAAVPEYGRRPVCRRVRSSTQKSSRKRGAQLLGPLPQPVGAGTVVGVEEIGAEQGGAVGVGLGLAAQRAAPLGIGQVRSVAHRSSQPGETALRDREESSVTCSGIPQRRASARSAGNGRVASVPVQPGGRWGPASLRGPACMPGSRTWPRELGTGEGAEACRPRARCRAEASYGRRQRASAGAIPQRHGAPAARWGSEGWAKSRRRRACEIVDTGPRSASTRGSSPGPCRGEVARRHVTHGSDGSRAVLADAQLDGHGTARWQFELPAQQACGGERVGWWRVGRDGGASGGAGPAQAGGVNAGGQFGSCGAGGDHAQVRQVGTERHLDRQAQRARRRAAQGDPLRAVRVADAFDDDVGVRSAVRGDAYAPTKRARSADVIRACSASGSRPATRTWHRASTRLPPR